MSTTDLMTWLRSLSGWEDGDPGDPAILTGAEAAIGHVLPTDYRELVLASNHAALTGPNEAINFEPIEDLAMLSDQYAQGLPGMVTIGDNGGGAVYFYDPADRLGHGPWALYWVNAGVLALSNARLAGTSLTDALHRIANGVSYFDEPKVQP